MAAGSHGTKAILAAFFANLGIAIAKFIGFAFTQASSMLAEAIHSVADTGNQALLLLGGRRAMGAIAIGILLGVIAVILAIEMKSMLIGESARPQEFRAIESAITASPHARPMYIEPDFVRAIGPSSEGTEQTDAAH